jgi:chemotaxis receptor (MCP) glutamine deamidase CheD
LECGWLARAERNVEAAREFLQVNDLQLISNDAVEEAGTKL